jgi:hypothetical protein
MPVQLKLCLRKLSVNLFVLRTLFERLALNHVTVRIRLHLLAAYNRAWIVRKPDNPRTDNRVCTALWKSVFSLFLPLSLSLSLSLALQSKNSSLAARYRNQWHYERLYKADNLNLHTTAVKTPNLTNTPVLSAL